MLIMLCTAALCLFSFALLVYDTAKVRSTGVNLKPTAADEAQELTEGHENTSDVTANEIPSIELREGLSKSVLIYSGAAIAITLAIAWFGHNAEGAELTRTLKRLSLLAILWPIAYTDLTTYRIPNAFVITGLIYRVVLFGVEVLLQSEPIKFVLLTDGVAAGALLIACLLCALIVKNSVGYGDIKILIVLGLMLGTEEAWGAVFTALIFQFFAAVTLLISKKKKRKDVMPFGPAIVLGAYLSVFLTLL